MAREGGGASLAPQVAPGEHYDDISSSSSSSKEKRPTGRVVGIIRRNWRTRGYSGSLQPDRLGRPAKQGPSNVLFCPVERRYPFIRIQTRQVCLNLRDLLEQDINSRNALKTKSHNIGTTMVILTRLVWRPKRGMCSSKASIHGLLQWAYASGSCILCLIPHRQLAEEMLRPGMFLARRTCWQTSA